jgi:hypothetical protein
MLYRPPGFATLPAGVGWRYVEFPPDGSIIASRRDDLPISRHRYGVFETDRDLTDDEMLTFQIGRVFHSSDRARRKP